MKASDVKDLKLPADIRWVEWHDSSIGIELLSVSLEDAFAVSRGCVTIDFDKRIYVAGLRAGCYRTSEIDAGKIRKGRGWRQKLVYDAVKYLRRICE